MADDFTVDASDELGVKFASDDVGGKHYPISKIALGALNSVTLLSGGAGSVDAGTPRTTLAADDPAVSLLGTIDADTGVIAGDTTSIDAKITACNTGAVVLAAGTAEIGKLAAGSAAIGTVSTTSQIPGTGATNLGKAEDGGHTTGDTGVMALAVRQSADAALSGSDLDYEPLQTDASGFLKVNIKAGSASGTEYTEDAAATANPAGGALIVIREDARAGSLTTTDGDNVAVRGNNSGEMYVKTTDSDALLTTIDTDTGTIAGDTTSIDGKITACNTGAVVLAAGTAEIGKLAAGVAEIGNVKNSGTFATQATLQAGTAEIGKLAAGSAAIGTVSTTAQIPGTGATNLGKAQDTAVGATDTGVAMLAKRDDEQSAVTPVDGDYVVPTADKYGKLKVTLEPDATSVPKFGVINAASSGDNTLQAAAGAGVKIRVTSLFVVSAGTVNVRFESGAAGTALTGQMPLVANSGFVLPYNPNGWFETADNALLNMELSAAIGVDGSFQYVEV